MALWQVSLPSRPPVLIEAADTDAALVAFKQHLGVEELPAVASVSEVIGNMRPAGAVPSPVAEASPVETPQAEPSPVAEAPPAETVADSESQPASSEPVQPPVAEQVT